MNDGMVAPAPFLKEVSREAAGGRASGAEALAEQEAQLHLAADSAARGEAQQRAASHLSLEGELAVVRAELKEARHEAEKRAAALPCD
jgi:hypothetical protein